MTPLPELTLHSLTAVAPRGGVEQHIEGRTRVRRHVGAAQDPSKTLSRGQGGMPAMHPWVRRDEQGDVASVT